MHVLDENTSPSPRDFFLRPEPRFAGQWVTPLSYDDPALLLLPNVPPDFIFPRKFCEECSFLSGPAYK